MATTSGDRVSELVPLPSGRCSKNDCLRAFVCAEAVLRSPNSDTGSGIEAFLRGIQEEFPFIEFGNIHMSVDLNPDYGFKFLVADAADAIFIAFQVSKNFNNSLGSALYRGEVDSAFFTLSRDFLGNDLNILTEHSFLRKGKRIVFCGHEFGGALAHMVVLQFWAPLFKSGNKVRKDLSEMISIAFGAPCICSSAYAEEVNGDKELKSHFFDFVHEHDPRRSIVSDYDHDGASTENAGGGRNLEVSRVGIRNGVADRVNEVAIIGKVTTHMKRAYNSVNFKTCKEPKFFPIGDNLVLKGSNTFASSLVPQFTSHPWSRDTFFNSYKSALTLELAPFTSESQPSDPKSKLVLYVTTPTPKITSAKLMAMDAQLKAKDSGRFVHVEGNHLLFLREPVKMNGLNPWICKIQKDNELYLFEPPQTDVKREGNVMENHALSFIVLKTAFGEASHLISENISGGPSDGVHRLLPKIVQAFMALASPPLCITQSSELLKDLDSIVQCALVLPNERLSTVLEEIANDKDLQKNILKINTMIQEVVEFLTRSCKIEYVDPLPIILGGLVGASLMLTGLIILLPASGIFYIVTGVATLFTSGCVATSTGTAAAAVAIYLSDKELLIPEYRAMLKIAIQEAQLWQDGVQISKLPEGEEVELESLLLEKVQRSGSLESRMQSIPTSGANAQDILFRSDILKGANVESKAKFLRKMQIVTKTLLMYNTEVKDIRFVGVVGAEDAGKSTFIRKAMRRFEGKLPDSELPYVGFKSHTMTVGAYKLETKKKLYLVDFPGSNGTGAYADAWKQFTSLPSSCILLLDFKDDIKQDQVDMYRKMKLDLGSKVSVVFNKVDEKFTPRREAYYDVDYFNKLRIDTAEKLQCEESDVYFACLDPDPEDKFVKLKNAGVLDFEELFERVVGLV